MIRLRPLRARAASALRPVLRLALAGPLAAVAACGGGGTAATGPAASSLVVAEMVLEDEAGTVYHSHRDHWHGFPVVPAGGELRVRQYFVARSASADDHEAPPRSEWFSLADHADAEVRVVVRDEAVGGWRGDRLTGALLGRRTGATDASLTIRRGPTTLRELPSLPVVVR
jgi:hypothetical protein